MSECLGQRVAGERKFIQGSIVPVTKNDGAIRESNGRAKRLRSLDECLLQRRVRRRPFEIRVTVIALRRQKRTTDTGGHLGRPMQLQSRVEVGFLGHHPSVSFCGIGSFMSGSPSM